MRPQLLVKSGEDAVLESIISSISDIECSLFFPNHLGKYQTDQKDIVTGFQELASSILRASRVNSF